MEILDALNLLRSMFVGLIGLLDKLVFRINGYEVTLGGMIFVFFIFLFVVSLFWKGAKA